LVLHEEFSNKDSDSAFQARGALALSWEAFY